MANHILNALKLRHAQQNAIAHPCNAGSRPRVKSERQFTDLVDAAQVKHGAFNRTFDVVKPCCYGIPFLFMPENLELCGDPHCIGMGERGVVLEEIEFHFPRLECLHQPVGQTKVNGLDCQPRHVCKKRWEVQGSLCELAEQCA
jgi:hypothetical protein